MVWWGPRTWEWASAGLHSEGALRSLGMWSVGWPHVSPVPCERWGSSADSGLLCATLRSPLGEEKMVTHVTRAPPALCLRVALRSGTPTCRPSGDWSVCRTPLPLSWGSGSQAVLPTLLCFPEPLPQAGSSARSPGRMKCLLGPGGERWASGTGRHSGPGTPARTPSGRNHKQ